MAPGNRKNPQRALSSDSTYTLVEFMADFPDDETCLNWLWRTRYAPDGEHALCTRCEAERAFKRYVGKQQRQDWTCTACGLHVHPTAGTIYHKSSTSLTLWFYAMYLMTSTRCGISAKQLERELGVTYKTAWRMFNLIRNQLMEQDPDQKLVKRVEMDETYVGGKPRASDRAKWPKEGTRQSAAVKWSADKKTPIFGMVERNDKVWVDGKAKAEIIKHGKVVAHVVPKKMQSEIISLMDNQIKDGARIYTDDSRLYDWMDKSGWQHDKVRHSRGSYVRDYHIHTQQIEGFWSLVKRGISGMHHAVSPKWLQGYVNEYVWRYNHRDNGREMFSALLLRSAFPVGS
jgi:transposase-like protein